MPTEADAPAEEISSRPQARHFLGLDFDRLSLEELVNVLAAHPAQAPFAYLVTPNVDHVVRLFDESDPQHEELWRAYRGARWCICDSRILARLARFRGVRLPVVPGSDLGLSLLRSGRLDGAEVAIIGSTAGALEELERRFPKIRFLHYSPPFGLRHDQGALDAAADFVARSGARFVFLSVGSPQQELLAARIQAHPNARGVGLCLGASIDFVTGRQKRAPMLVQQLHLEWAYRLLNDPRRLWRRYLVTGPRIFTLARHWSPCSQAPEDFRGQ